MPNGPTMNLSSLGSAHTIMFRLLLAQMLNLGFQLLVLSTRRFLVPLLNVELFFRLAQLRCGFLVRYVCF